MTASPSVIGEARDVAAGPREALLGHDGPIRVPRRAYGAGAEAEAGGAQRCGGRGGGRGRGRRNDAQGCRVAGGYAGGGRGGDGGGGEKEDVEERR